MNVLSKGNVLCTLTSIIMLLANLPCLFFGLKVEKVEFQKIQKSVPRIHVKFVSENNITKTMRRTMLI